MKTGELTLRRITAKEHGHKYHTNLVSGTLNGIRVRKKFRSCDDALGELNRLQIAAANAGGEIQAVNTRLSAGQLAEAEAAYSSLDGKSLSLTIQWFKDTYRPPVTAMDLKLAVVAFIAEKRNHVRPIVLRDYERTLRAFIKAHPHRTVHSITTVEVQGFLTARIRLRMQRARELLESTDRTVAEIGAALGYDDPLYFSRLFRQKVGQPPTHYRRGHWESGW